MERKPAQKKYNIKTQEEFLYAFKNKIEELKWILKNSK